MNVPALDSLPPASEMIPLNAAAKLFPVGPNGRHPRPSTLWRWRLKGVRGVRLACWYVGTKVYTTRQAVDDFLRGCTAVALETPEVAALEPKKKYPKEVIEGAARVREKLGIVGGGR